MWRLLLVLIGLLSSLNGARAAGEVWPPLETAETFELYLPRVTKHPLPVEVVVTARGASIGYPTYYYAYGYVRGSSSEPLYGVKLAVEVTIYPYDDDDSSPPAYTIIEEISPALNATLPNAINPFSYGLILGKASASIRGIWVIDASLTGPGGKRYYPLEVVDWEYAEKYLLGSVRNDSRISLQEGRVVVAELTKCGWQEAELGSPGLQPGQETTFQLSFSEYCRGDNLVVVGQGAAQP